jgi:predicted nucleic acid-binding protein
VRPDAILNTSPLLYLHRANALSLLSVVFGSCWTTAHVLAELAQGGRQGLMVPTVSDLAHVTIRDSDHLPDEWLALDLGRGEVSVMALALQHRNRVVVLDDLLARRMAAAAGLEVWGTLRILLEGKKCGAVSSIGPVLRLLRDSGMWISEEIYRRILVLAGE